MQKHKFSALRWADRAHLALFRPHVAVGFFTLGTISITCSVASIILCLELRIGSDVGGWLQLLGTSCNDRTMTGMYSALGLGQLITGFLLWDKSKEKEKDRFLKDVRRKEQRV
jgi:hypothetical protein